MYLSKFRSNSLLLFALAFPIVALSGILHGARSGENFHIIYLSIFSLLFVWLCGRLFSREDDLSPFRPPVLALSLTAFYCLCVLQLLFFLAGAREGLTTLDPYLTYKTLPVVFAHLLLFFFFLDAFRSSRTILYYFNCLFMLAFALSLLGLLQDIIPNIWRKNMFFVTTINIDFYSTFYSNDHFAFFLNLILPLAAATTLWEVMTRYSWKRPLATLLHIARRPLVIKILGVFIIGVTTGWTGSRSGTIAIGAALCFTTLLFFLVTWKKAPGRLPLLIVLLAIAALAVPSLLLFTGVPNALKQIYWWYLRIGDIVIGASEDASFATRVVIYKSLIPAISYHPIFGTGIGTFFTSFASYKPPAVGQMIWGHALNEYLEIIFETGIVGFALLVFIPFGVLIRLLFRYFGKRADLSGTELVLLVGSLGGCVAAGIHSATDFSLKLPTAMLTFLSIAAIPFALLLRNAETAPQRSLKRLTALPLIALVIIHGVMFELPFQAASKREKEGMSALPQAIRLDPLNPDYRIQSLRQGIAKSRWSEEEKTINGIIRISPRARTHGDLGEMLSIKGNVDKEYPSRAVPYLEKAVLLVPMEDDYLVTLITNQIRLAKIAEEESNDTDPYLETIRRALASRVSLEKGLSPKLKKKVAEKLPLFSTPLFQKKVGELLDELSSPTPAE